LFLVLFRGGLLQRVEEAALAEIASMGSVRGVELFVSAGGVVGPTVDCFSFAGLVQLIHSDLSQLERDYQRIRELEASALFTVV